MLKKLVVLGIILLFLLVSIFPIMVSSISSSYNNIIYVDNDEGAYYTKIHYKIENGSLSGFINDSNSQPIQGAVVDIKCGGIHMQNTSDYTGFYYIDNVPIVDCYWNASASKEEYETFWVEMSIDINSTYDFVLTPLGKTLYVGGSGAGNYTTIQSAIDDANDGDTVFVYAGTYYENVVVNKSIILEGEDKNKTVIDGSNLKDVVKIWNVDKVSISGFTILNSGNNKAGVYIYRSADGIISNNLIIDNNYGVYVYKNASTGFSHTTISDNIILRNSVFGVWLYKSSNNVVSDNIISDGEIYGLGLCFWSTDTIVNGNIISNNKIKGIVGRYVYNNEIYHNIIENNSYGINFMNASSNNSIYNNHIEGNTFYGICFEDISNNNIIENNNFINNTPRDAFFITPLSITNEWNKNYWNRGRIFPYPIFGKFQIGIIQIPWIQFDWHPAKEPNILSPVIEVGPYTQNVTDESITIVWETNIPTVDNYILFDETTDYKYKTYLESNCCHHKVTIVPSFSTGYYKVSSDELQSKDYNFHLSNQCLETGEFRCILFGDSRGTWDDWEHASLVAVAVNNESPDIVIHGGDMVDDGSVDEQWSIWLDLMMPLMQNSTVYGVIGNHEHNASRYYEIFALPHNEMWYSFDYGPCHFIILDNYVDWNENSVQYSWLEADLSMTNQSFIVVCFHEPIYCSGGHSSRIDIREAWEPLFNQYHVDLVVQSHCHFYQRTIPINDTIYIVSGGAGAPLYSPSDDWFIELSKKAYHYCILDVSLDSMEMICTVKDLDGVIIDEFRI